MTQIRVDIEVLRATVRTFTEAAQRVLADSREVENAVEGASGYDGQLRARVSAIAGQAGPDLRAFADHAADLAAQLERVADGFEAADAAQVAGLAGLAVSFRTMIDSGYGAADLPLWLVRGDKPPWMSAEEWARLGRLGEQASYVADLQRLWASFVSGDLTFNHGTQQDMLNAFRVHLFLEGVTTGLPPYADWQSAAVAAGLSLEGYVMHVLNITAFERDTVAGVGLAETRTVGPVGMLLCEVTYLNRVRQGSMWGSYETAWKGFTRVGGYNLELDGTMHNGRAYADYLSDSVSGGTAQAGTVVFSASDYFHYLQNKDLYTHAAAAIAAQDMSWRLLAGHRLSELTGEMHVAHFLSDAEAQWWKYHNQLVGAELVVYETYPASYAEQVKAQLLEQNPTRYDGNETQLVIDANNLLRARFVDSYPDPSTLEGAVEMVERAYGFGNQFESNPSTTSLTEFRQVNYDPDAMAEDFPGLPNDTQVIVLPKYAQMVYDTARGLADQGLPLEDAYLDHYRSLVIVLNRKTGVGFASYYFPTEDPAHLPSYP